MRHLLIAICCTVFCSAINAQTITFDVPNKTIVKEAKEDKSITIPFTLDGESRDNVTITVSIDDKNGSATSIKDFVLSSTSIEVKKAEKYKGNIALIIKADSFIEYNEDIALIIAYKDKDNKDKTVNYLVTILDVNDGGESDPVYTEREKNKVRRISYDLFTGGNFDFFDALKIQHFGGELVVNIKDIAGRDDRFGLYTGIFNFQNFSFDSSNQNIRTVNTRYDNSTYVSGTTKYLQSTYVDHQKTSINQ